MNQVTEHSRRVFPAEDILKNDVKLWERVIEDLCTYNNDLEQQTREIIGKRGTEILGFITGDLKGESRRAFVGDLIKDGILCALCVLARRQLYPWQVLVSVEAWRAVEAADRAISCAASIYEDRDYFDARGVNVGFGDSHFMILRELDKAREAYKAIIERGEGFEDIAIWNSTHRPSKRAPIALGIVYPSYRQVEDTLDSLLDQARYELEQNSELTDELVHKISEKIYEAWPEVYNTMGEPYYSFTPRSDFGYGELRHRDRILELVAKSDKLREHLYYLAVGGFPELFFGRHYKVKFLTVARLVCEFELERGNPEPSLRLLNNYQSISEAVIDERDVDHFREGLWSTILTLARCRNHGASKLRSALIRSLQNRCAWTSGEQEAFRFELAVSDDEKKFQTNLSEIRVAARALHRSQEMREFIDWIYNRLMEVSKKTSVDPKFQENCIIALEHGISIMLDARNYSHAGDLLLRLREVDFSAFIDFVMLVENRTLSKVQKLPTSLLVESLLAEFEKEWSRFSQVKEGYEKFRSADRCIEIAAKIVSLDTASGLACLKNLIINGGILTRDDARSVVGIIGGFEPEKIREYLTLMVLHSKVDILNEIYDSTLIKAYGAIPENVRMIVRDFHAPLLLADVLDYARERGITSDRLAEIPTIVRLSMVAPLQNERIFSLAFDFARIHIKKGIAMKKPDYLKNGFEILTRIAERMRNSHGMVTGSRGNTYRPTVEEFTARLRTISSDLKSAVKFMLHPGELEFESNYTTTYDTRIGVAICLVTISQMSEDIAIWLRGEVVNEAQAEINLNLDYTGQRLLESVLESRYP